MTGNRPPKVYILGIGNPLRQDDGFGPAVADRLLERWADREELGIYAVHQLLPEWAERWSHAEWVILIDAAYATTEDDAPGSLRIQLLDPNAKPEEPFDVGHHVQPGVLLQLAQSIYGRVPPVTLITCTGAEFGLIEGLTPQIEAAIDRTLAAIDNILAATL